VVLASGKLRVVLLPSAGPLQVLITLRLAVFRVLVKVQLMGFVVASVGTVKLAVRLEPLGVSVVLLGSVLVPA
jgi:hypothetical protein